MTQLYILEPLACIIFIYILLVINGVEREREERRGKKERSLNTEV